MYFKLILNWFVKFFDSNSKDIFKTFATFPQKNTLDGSEKSIFPYGTEKNNANGTTDPGVDCFNQYFWFDLVGRVWCVWFTRLAWLS